MASFSAHKELDFKGLKYFMNGEYDLPSKTVVFLHGNTASKESFLDLVPLLNDAGFSCVILVDLPGFGASTEIDGPYTVRNACTWINQLLSFIGVESCVFAGWSLGGHIALRYYKEYPEQVHGLVTFGTPPINSDDPALLGEAFGKAFDGSEYEGYDEAEHMKLIGLLSKGDLLTEEEAEMFMRHPVADESFFDTDVYQYQVQVAMTSKKAGQARQEYLGSFFTDVNDEGKVHNEYKTALSHPNIRMIHAEFDGAISYKYMQSVDEAYHSKWGKNILHVINGAKHACFMSDKARAFVDVFRTLE